MVANMFDPEIAIQIAAQSNPVSVNRQIERYCRPGTPSSADGDDPWPPDDPRWRTLGEHPDLPQVS